MNIDIRIVQLSNLISLRSESEAAYYPIDRTFLENYLSEILSLNSAEFILDNLERGEITYTVILLAALPELWENLDVEDIINIIDQFTNSFAFYSFIIFTYKFIEVNFIDLIMKMGTVSVEQKQDIKDFLLNQFPNLTKDEDDYFLFGENIYGSLESWRYIKQRLLLDERVSPAITSLDELKDYVEKLSV